MHVSSKLPINSRGHNYFVFSWLFITILFSSIPLQLHEANYAKLCLRQSRRDEEHQKATAEMLTELRSTLVNTHTHTQAADNWCSTTRNPFSRSVAPFRHLLLLATSRLPVVRTAVSGTAVVHSLVIAAVNRVRKTDHVIGHCQLMGAGCHGHEAQKHKCSNQWLCKQNHEPMLLAGCFTIATLRQKCCCVFKTSMKLHVLKLRHTM